MDFAGVEVVVEVAVVAIVVAGDLIGVVGGGEAGANCSPVN